MAHEWLTSISSNSSKPTIVGCCNRSPEGPTANATGVRCRTGTTSSSGAKKENDTAYPRGRQSLRRSKSSGEATQLEAIAFGIIVPRPRTEDLPKPVLIDGLIDRYLDQIETLKKPNTFRKYNAVLKRFAKHFAGRVSTWCPSRTSMISS